MSEEYARLHNKYETDLSKIFFHSQNVEYIQKELQRHLLKSGYKTKLQKANLIESYMFNIFELHVNSVNSNIKKEIQKLNSVVIKKMTDVMIHEIKQYIGYVKDASELPVPLDQPRHFSTKQSLEYQSF